MGVEWSLCLKLLAAIHQDLDEQINKLIMLEFTYFWRQKRPWQQFEVKALVPVTLTLWLVPTAEKMASTGNTEMWDSEVSRI